MIYVKTKLKKMPKTCKECVFSANYSYYPTYFSRTCVVSKQKCPTEKSQYGNTRYTKPVWCPLLEGEVK